MCERDAPVTPCSDDVLESAHISGVVLASVIAALFKGSAGAKELLTLYGHKVTHIRATDTCETSRHTEAVISIALPARCPEATPVGAVFLGFASIRRGSAHKLSFQESMYLSRSDAPQIAETTQYMESHRAAVTSHDPPASGTLLPILLLVTTISIEPGSDKVEITLFQRLRAPACCPSTHSDQSSSSVYRPAIVRLVVDNVVDSLSAFTRVGDLYVRANLTKFSPCAETAVKPRSMLSDVEATELLEVFEQGMVEVKQLTERKQMLEQRALELRAALSDHDNYPLFDK